MGGNAFKIEVCTHDRIAVVAFDGVFCCRMPGVYEINVVEHSGAGHELFGTGTFFSRAAEVDDRSVFLICDQVFFHSDRCCERTGSECAVTASMAGSAFRQRFFVRICCFLA